MVKHAVKLRAMLVLSVSALALLLVGTSVSAQTTFNVDGSDPACSDTTGGPYCTIQAAIDAAANGDTIQIAAGLYEEFVSVDKELTLSGPNAGLDGASSIRAAEAVVVPEDGSYSDAIITILADNVTVEGLEVNGNNPNLAGGVDINGEDVNANTGILVPNYFGTDYENITVRNNVVRNINWYGLYAGGLNNDPNTLSENNLIEGNLFDNMPGTSASVGGAVGSRRGLAFFNEFNTDVLNNTVTRAGIGIQDGASFVAAGGTYSISNNDVSATGVGIYHNLWAAGTPTYTIQDNTVTASGTATNVTGIYVISISNTANVLNNQISDVNRGILLSNNDGTVDIDSGTIVNVQRGIEAGDAFGGPVTTDVSNVVFDGVGEFGILVIDDDGAGDDVTTLTVNNIIVQNSAGSNGIEVVDNDGTVANVIDVSDSTFDGLTTGVNFVSGDANNSGVNESCFVNNQTGVNSDVSTLTIMDNIFFNNTNDTTGDVNNQNPIPGTSDCSPVLPIANDDTGATTSDQSVTIDVLPNDVNTSNLDPSNPVSIVGAVSDGTVSVSGTNVTFTPEANFVGTAEFQYVLTDNNGFSSEPATVTIDVLPAPADLAVTKTVSLTNDVDGDGAYDPGDTLEYTVGVTNNGPADTVGVEITDSFPADLTLVSSSATQGNYDGASLWDVGTLNSGDSATLTIAATVNSGTEGSDITNTAEVSNSDVRDDNADNNSASITITVGTDDVVEDDGGQQTDTGTTASPTPSPIEAVEQLPATGETPWWRDWVIALLGGGMVLGGAGLAWQQRAS